MNGGNYRQQGLPNARHKRFIEAASEGMALRLVIDYESRNGFAGLFDRFIMEQGVERALRKTNDNIERFFLKTHNL